MIEFKAGDKVVFDMQGKHFEHLADRVFSVVRVCGNIGTKEIVQICDEEMPPTAVAERFLAHTAELPPPETAQEWMNRHGLKVGDEVRVVRMDKEWISWVEPMEELIDCVGEIHRCDRESILLYVGDDEDAWWFRPCSLDPVEKASESVKMLDELLKRNTESILNLPPGADIEIVRGNLKPDSPPVICDDGPSPAQRKEYLDEFAKWKKTVKVGDWFEVIARVEEGDAGWDSKLGYASPGLRGFASELKDGLVVLTMEGPMGIQCKFPFWALTPCAKPESYNVAYPTLKEFLG
jgi:hypothetical protein